MSLSRNMQPYLGGNHATMYAVALACPLTGLDQHAVSMPDCHTLQIWQSLQKRDQRRHVFRRVRMRLHAHRSTEITFY